MYRREYKCIRDDASNETIGIKVEVEIKIGD